MDELSEKANAEVIGFVKNLDSQPETEREVTYWFYAETEEQGYNLAADLQKRQSNIDVFEKTMEGDYLIICRVSHICTIDELNHRCEEMSQLAEKNGVVFDGWETELKL